jgi:chromosome segregation ATPase
MRFLRPAVVTSVLAVVAGSIVFGQQQKKSATLDDLVAEIRLLRADLNRASETTVRANLVTARLASQEGRISTLMQQRSNVRQQIAEAQLSLAPFALQLKQAQESNSEILAPLRNTVEQVQKREQELRAQEAELDQLITSGQNRWMDYNSQLDEIERALPVTPAR